MKEREIKQYMGSQLTKKRLSLELNQTELANNIGVSQSYVSDWESGDRWINTKRLIDICNFFRISITYFFPKELNDTPPVKLIELIPSLAVALNDEDSIVRANAALAIAEIAKKDNT